MDRSRLRDYLRAKPGSLSGAVSSGSIAPAFDVATVKPHATTTGLARMMGVMNTPDGLNVSGATLF
jgi:hypothetical protein